MQECDAKSNEYRKQGKEAQRIFTRECAKLHIAGDNVRNELIASTDKSATVLQEVVNECRKLGTAIDFYRQCIAVYDTNDAVKTSARLYGAIFCKQNISTVTLQRQNAAADAQLHNHPWKCDLLRVAHGVRA